MLDEQIKALYETANLDPAIIADQLGLDENSVKISLGSNSAKFRAAVRSGDEVFGDDVYKEAIATMQGLLYAEQENVKLRAAKFIINEKKGRNDVKHLVNNVKNLNINVSIVSEQIKKARAALNESKKLIDIPSREGSEN